ncbi:T9SS type A sorting domain-containing protein [Ohtaekwangia koreensis]|uniref:Por secretion system C-terminal sorting domain-containing protein n=1 Tax=Ohtaekwangia koreensis TaxID=688867 RepID=A0A1T5LZY4_9BACT|nr:T9SS type A sorting domain-containing protein [Ohtaekwangia koreensis]SKC81463.1 Por secretion system C-terminal sorting domain-containing protein [Ohtaekwangia koreensis]
MKIRAGLLSFFLLCSTYIYSQRYWVASTSSNWNNTANWSATSGGIGGASVPGASDAVVFNGAGGLQGNCILDIAPTVSSVTVNGYSGTIDLNGFNLISSGTTAATFTTGLITNGGAPATITINTTGIATFNGTHFGISTAIAPLVTCTASQVYLNGSIFFGTTYLEKTGGTNNLGSGGNTFHGTTTLANSGSAYLATGFSSPDVFNADLTVTNTGSSFIGLADNTLNNMFNGNIIVNSSGSGSGFFSGILFANGPGATGTKSSYLANGKTISVGTGYTSGTLSLAGFHQADAATALSLTTTGSSVLYIGPSTAFAGNVMFKAPQVYLQGCTYSGTAYLEKSGGTNNLGTGGNTFQSAATIVNSGSAFLATGYNNADTFNGDLIVTNTGTGWVAMADNASASIFNGNITVNSTNAGANAGITFGNGPGTNVAATLASGKTITVGSGFSAGKLLLRRFVQSGSTAQNLTFTGTAALYLGPYSTFNGAVTFITPQVYLQGATYNNTSYIQKNGGTNNAGAGGNIFNSTTTLVNSGSGWLETATTTADIFNGDVTLTNTGSSIISMASATAGNMFNGNIIVNSTSGIGIRFANNTTTGAATLASGKTITVGSTGFSAGTLTLQKFTQSGSTAQNMALTGTATLTLGPSSVFNGNIIFTGPRILLNGSIYNGTASITKNGTTTNTCDGGNVFNATTSLTNSSDAIWLFANITGDTFNGPVTFSQTSTGALQPAYNGTNSFYDNLIVSSANVVTLGSGTGVVQFAGSNNQTITSASSIPVIQRLTMSKASGANTITLNTPINIGSTATLTTGIINTTTSNYLNFLAGSTVNGASNASYINGPVRKTGNTAFIFPTGNASTYRSIAISAPAVGSDVFTAQYFKTSQAFGDQSTFTAPLVRVSGCEYWTLDRTVGTSNVNVTLSWNSSGCTGPYITDLSALLVARWNGSAWVTQGNGGTSGDATAGTIVTTPAVTTFSPFALGSTSPNNPLPVKLLSFTADQKGDKVLLEWKTVWEKDNDFFVIERSSDGLNYHTVGRQPASGNSSIIQHYIMEDHTPYLGRSYYRIKQTDVNGATEYLDTKTITIRKEENISVFPNPFDGENINFLVTGFKEGKCNYLILDISGVQRLSGEVLISGKENDPYKEKLSEALAAGIYYLQLYKDNFSKTIKLIVRP